MTGLTRDGSLFSAFQLSSHSHFSHCYLSLMCLDHHPYRLLGHSRMIVSSDDLLAGSGADSPTDQGPTTDAGGTIPPLLLSTGTATDPDSYSPNFSSHRTSYVLVQAAAASVVVPMAGC